MAILSNTLDFLLVVLALTISVAETVDYCSSYDENIKVPLCYKTNCLQKIKDQIKEELDAALTYLHMGAMLGEYTISRPGLAKFFIEAASEERSHAIQMLDYLNKRGDLYASQYVHSELNSLKLFNMIVDENVPRKITTMEFLNKALTMEIKVTNLIADIVENCNSDYHAADFFTDPILAEQHTSIRTLQRAITTFKELQGGQPNNELAEFIFDIKMLNGEI